MNTGLLLVALLLPPAMYGLLVLIETDRANRRAVARVRAWNAHVDDAMRVSRGRHPTTIRCLVCPTNPIVDDPETHTRLVHSYRARGPEDSDWWAGRG